MLSGRPAFDPGDTISDAVAAVLKSEPDWNQLPADVPLRLHDLVRRCLTKDPRNRIRDSGDVRIAVEEAIGSPDTLTPAAVRTIVAARVPAWRRAVPWAIAAVAVVLAVVAWAPWRQPPTPAVMRLNTEIGVDASLSTGSGAAAFLSPDGHVLAFTAVKAGQRSQLFVRRLDQLQAKVLAGTDGARNAFFSPDGQSIGFFADGKLKKVSVNGGAAVTLCDAADDRGGTWVDDGSIVFTPNNRSGLWRVSSAGGTPEPLTTLDQSAREITHRWPHALPGGRGVLYVASATSNIYEDADIVVQAFGTGRRRTVHRGGYAPQYVVSGHLVYMHGGTLFAAPFDLDRLEMIGQPVPVLEGVASTPANGASQVAFSVSGTATYIAGAGLNGGTSIFMARDGKTQLLREPTGTYLNMRFSPDGRRLAMEIAEQQHDVWTYEWDRDAMSRLTFEATQDARPVCAPLGGHLAFGSQRGNKSVFNLYWQNADGTGEAHRLTESPNTQYPMSWHPGG